MSGKRARCSIRTRDDHSVAVRIAQPTLPVIWPATSIWRIALPRQDDFSIHFQRSIQRVVKVVHFKPQKHTVAIRLVVGISNSSVMMVDLEAVQLHYQGAIGLKSFGDLVLTGMRIRGIPVKFTGEERA